MGQLIFQWREQGNKQCGKCGEVKAVEEFSKQWKWKRCKGCVVAYRKAWQVKNREVRTAYDKAYRAVNRETRNTKNKAYYVANREIIVTKRKARYVENRETRVAYGKAYHVKNREVIAARDKARRAKNRETRGAWQKAYYVANREVVIARVKVYLKTPGGKATRKASDHKRRNRGQFAFDRLVTRKDFQHWEKHGAVCYLTGVALLPGAVTWDHVIPLYWGGTQDPWNFLPASFSANSSKHTRLVYFDLATREPRYTLDPCPGGTGPNGETWPRIPLTQPSLDEMQEMVDTWKARRGMVK